MDIHTEAIAGGREGRLEVYQGTVSLKLLGGKLAPKLVYLVLRKELLKP